jgi:myo-inositol 2-dehydrogenase / D-chiro-inositol 1-dehydrogenase
VRHREIGVAIIGAGRIGTLRATLAAAHPGVRFMAVADTNIQQARTLAVKTSAQLVCERSMEAISHPQVDAVIVSTSEHEHTAPVLQALQLGKAVLVEKPIALELEDASRILAALENTKGSLRVGYSRRFKRRYLTAKEQLKRGRLGKVVGISARLYNTRAQVYQMLDRNPGATPVVDSLTYYVDLLGWFVPDNPVVEVCAWGQAGTIRARGYNCDDVTFAVLKLADGALVNLGVSFALPDRYPSLGYSGRFEILGTEGSLIIDDDHLDQVMYTERGIPHIYIPDHTVNMAFLGSSAPGDWAEGDFWGPLANETRAWLDHLTTGRPCALTTAAEARNNLAITLAIEHAVASGKPVTLHRSSGTAEG